MKAVLLALALLGSASAFSPVVAPRAVRYSSRVFAEEGTEAAGEAVAAEVAEEEAAPAPTPAPVPPPMTASAYMETLYGGLGNPETGGKIPPMAYKVVDLGTPATVDFMRAAELKHGRIAMMGTLGWAFNLLNIHFPGMLSSSEGISFASLDAMNPVDAFFGLPASGLGQIFAFCAIFEFYEMTHKDGKYVGNNVLMGQMVPNVNKWDILGFTEGKSEEDLAEIKLKELKNGRLAMIGVLGFVAAATIPNSVPMLIPFF